MNSIKRPFTLTFLSLVLIAPLRVLPAETPVIVAAYPSELHYFGAVQTQSQMQRLSEAVTKILWVMSISDQPLQNQRITVLEQLDAIESITNEIRGSNTKTRHLMLDIHINDFEAAVKQAITGAKAEPPQYFYVGQLMGSCLACHAVNR